ncbi:MAG: glycosyltransferase [Comamonadaceae bacterium]|nr:glycosyltransferase [Comamonadaceae bacterium]
MIGSVMDQTYDNWELCLADASTNAEIGELIRQYEEKNPQRLRVKRLDRNLGIAGNSNEALKLATKRFRGSPRSR